MNAAILQKRVEDYFRCCDLTRQEVPQKNGSVSITQDPYTFYGLCAALSLPPEKVLLLSEKNGKTGGMIRTALCKIAAHLTEKALLGDFPHQMVLPLLREIGFLTEEKNPDEGIWEVFLSEEAREMAE